MPPSSVSLIATSTAGVGAAASPAATPIARCTMSSAPGSASQQSAVTTISAVSIAVVMVVLVVFLAAVLGVFRILFARRLPRRGSFIGCNNALHQLVTDNVFGGKPDQ